ncbi:MAG: hypothetical protein M3P83_12775 [Actinomycetota bacterium]|nr:hypothetical protein [Actinomycetota bacterium]
MWWDELFADLEREWEAIGAAEQVAEVADRTRGERAQVSLLDRLRASVACRVVVATAAGESDGVLNAVGADFALVETAHFELLVPTWAMQTVTGLRPAARTADTVGAVASRLGLRAALRRLSRDRTPVDVVLPAPGTVHGTLQNVGADYVDVAVHAVGEAPRAGAVRHVTAVPLAALCAVRRGAARL